MPRWIAPALFLGLGLGTGWLGARNTQASTPKADADGWQTALVEARDIGATVLATGVVRAKVGAQVAVGSRASGVLQKLYVTVGDRVQAGQLLAQLDAIELETNAERAEALRMNAAAERAYAEGEYNRITQLTQTRAATDAELTAARRGLETARAKEREAAAAVAAARIQLGYTSIRAPISGVVASVSTQEGETVAASFAAPTFLTIVDLSRLEVWAYVDETDIGRIQVGQRAPFTVDTYPDETFEGRVTAVRPTAEVRDNVVNYVTLIAIENRAGKLLRPEMTATINIVLQGKSEVRSVPNGALRRDPDGTFVLLATPSGPERRTVQIGFRGSDFTELVSGLELGDRVVLGPTSACENTPTTDSRS